METIIIDAVNQVLAAVVCAAVTALAGWAVTLIGRWKKLLQAETDNINDERARTAVKAAVDRVGELALMAVETFEQTVAGELRAKVKAGAAPREALAAVGKMAVDEIYTNLDKKYIAALNEAIPDLPHYLASLVESKLLEMKTGGGAR